MVNGPEWPAAFLRIVWMECTGVPGALGDPAKMEASRGGWRVCWGLSVTGIAGDVSLAGGEDGWRE